jgi:Tfp pilus assembly protein PilO
MSLTARDRRIILILIPIVAIIAYYFMVLSPKREEASKVAHELTQAQSKRDQAEAQLTQLNQAKATFPSDFATVIRLGKAVPTTVDMPSLILQINQAAAGTGLTFQDFKPGPRSDGATGASSSPASTPPGGGSNPAAPGSAPAQSFPGKQAQKAGNAVTQANNTSQAQANATASGPSGATGPTGPTGAAGPSDSSTPGLVTVPLTFNMRGNFFGLADFFHRMKRFVQVVNDQIVVRGRLLTIDSFSFQKSDPASSLLTASVNATVYLTPADQGTSAGATPQGPAPTVPGGAPQPASSSAPSTQPPTATAAP